MLFSVYMNDKATFDALWKYEQKHLNTHGLMHWRINSNGTTAGMNSATDADEDIAFALVMADQQWGGYTTTATNMLNTVAQWDFGTDGTIKGGDFYVAVNPSYIAPAFYRVFAAYLTDATQKARWMTILDKNYEILAAVQNATSGLVPDWSAGPATNTNYGYDATRTPFRVALDYCWSGDARAKTFSNKIGAFFAGIGAANIVDGYALDGTPEPDPDTTTGLQSAVFVGSAAVGAMHDVKYQSFIDEAYARVATGELLARSVYYNHSWTTLSLLMLSGNLIQYAPRTSASRRLCEARHPRAWPWQPPSPARCATRAVTATARPSPARPRARKDAQRAACCR
jgi:endo-1,4-beta-D-glucanase Y